MSTPIKSKDAALSFFDNAVIPTTPFDIEFIEFLGSALIPTFSENLNTSRTDVLLEEAALKRNPQARTILDLCSGQPLLLEKLMHDISAGLQEAREYYYIGCDKKAGDELFDNMWSQLAERAKPLGIRAVCVPANASDPDFVRHALQKYHDGQFDVIYFANALHEVRPAQVPSLLYMLVELLSDKGELVILDPDPVWLFDAKHWEGLQDLRHLNIDWEVKAVWLPHSTYQQILESYGCTVVYQRAERNQEFWVLYVRRGEGFDKFKREELVEDANRKIIEAIDRQMQEQNDSVRNSRRGLITELMRQVGRNNKRIRNKGVEFLCLSTSQARRIEAILAFNQP